MTHRRKFLALLAGATACFGIPAAAQGWTRFTREDLGFSVELPGTPRVSTDEDPTPDGPMKVVTAELDFGDINISVAQTEFPAGLAAQRRPDQWIDDVRDHAVEVMKTPLLSERRFTLQGFPAGDFAFAPDPMQMRMHVRLRIVATPERIYQVALTRSTSLENDPTAERVIRSFALRA